MNIKRIIRILLSPTTIKIVGLIGIVWFFFVLPTYAATTTADSEVLIATKEFLQTVLSLCSRWWIILAILAGKLMTNDFVYGAFMHMDIYLWKIRNIMKNFANFALAGLVLVSIVQGLVGKEALNVKKIITNTLIAAILIQASRFLMWAVIDISTIATAGIWAFPTAFLKNDIQLQTNITNSITTFKARRGIINLTTQTTWLNNMFTSIPETSQSVSATRENILPNQNSISGPFIYLGMAVFSFQNYLTIGQGSTALPNLTLGFALRFFMLFLFTVALLLMLIANIMRIWLLWIFIIWSPFLILIKVFNKKVWGSGWLEKIFSVANLISAVFKPVIFVAGMSLMLIIIVSMQNSISWSWATRENNLNGVSLGKNGPSTSTLNIDWITSISINQKDLLGADVIGPNALGQTQNFFSELIMLLLTLFLMRQFIKLSLTLGGWTIEETMKGLIKSTEGMAKAMPILPWWISATGASKIMSKNTDKMLGGFGVNKSGEFGEMGEWWRFTRNETKFDNYVRAKLLWELPWWDENDDKVLWKLIEGNTNDGTAFFSKSRELAQAKSWWISRTTGTRLASLKTLLANPALSDDLHFLSKLEKNATDEQMKIYFSVQQNLTALRTAMWWKDATPGKNVPTSYEDLKAMTFYPNREKK